MLKSRASILLCLLLAALLLAGAAVWLGRDLPRWAVERLLARFEGTVVMVTHDPRLAARADRIWHLERGRVVAEGPPDEVLCPGSVTWHALHDTSLAEAA